MTITTEPFGVRTITAESKGKTLSVHYHHNGYGPRITFRADPKVMASGIELTVTDATELAEALLAMTKGAA